MIELHANDWFNIAGRGQLASINLRDIEGCPERIEHETQIPIQVGEHVLIDGNEYQIRGIEYMRALTDPPFIKPDVGLQVRPVDAADPTAVPLRYSSKTTKSEVSQKELNTR